MRKLILVLIALLFAAAFAVAEDNGATDADTGTGSDDSVIAPVPEPVVEESDTAVGKSIVEEETPKPSIVRKPIARLHLVGNGIAISEADAFDFMHARAVIGAVKVKAGAADANLEVKRVGVLTLDGKKYHLKDIAVSAEEISAEIYGPTTDATAASAAIGEIKVKRFEKPGKDIWAGNMVLNGKAYNVYFLGVKRDFKKAEITEKIGEQCKNNPDDARCKNIVAQCAQNKEQCGERVKNYCEANPTNIRCLQLKKLYCLRNATDERCREYLKGLCEKHPKLAHCNIQTVEGKKLVGIRAEKVASITKEKGEVAKNLVAIKERPIIKNIVKNRVENKVAANIRSRIATGATTDSGATSNATD